MAGNARAAVRIFAGRWKGRRLDVPEGARPTSGRAREALFSILQKRIPGAHVLDLYAGSGAIGLEAVSRGAESAVLVEKNAAVLRRNLAKLPSPEGRVAILDEDVATAVYRLAGQGRRFDLVFADPPYDRPAAALLARMGGVLAAGGLFVLQTDRFEPPPSESGLLRLVERRDYGRNVLFFFSEEAGVRPSSESSSKQVKERW